MENGTRNWEMGKRIWEMGGWIITEFFPFTFFPPTTWESFVMVRSKRERSSRRCCRFVRSTHEKSAFLQKKEILTDDGGKQSFQVKRKNFLSSPGLQIMVSAFLFSPFFQWEREMTDGGWVSERRTKDFYMSP